MSLRGRLRPWLLSAALGLLSVPFLIAGLIEVSKANCLVLIGDVVCRGETRERLVALTFDDGPTEAGVNAVLPLLDRYEAKGTFFLIGDRASPALVKRIAAAGHEIGNHSFSHKTMIFKSPSFYDEEIRRTDAAIEAAGALRPTLFRPPFGKKLIGLPLAARRNEKRIVMWDAGDPPDRDPRIFAEKTLSQVRPGSIVLIHPMHSGNATERAALPIILEGLSKRGFRMVTVSELLSQNHVGRTGAGHDTLRADETK